MIAAVFSVHSGALSSSVLGAGLTVISVVTDLTERALDESYQDFIIRIYAIKPCLNVAENKKEVG